jgi:3-methyladenine DNA glycosylase AlkD
MPRSLASASPTSKIVAELDAALRRAGSPARAVQEKRYLKSELAFYGSGVPALRREVKALWRAHGPFERKALLALAEALWREPVHERRSAAVELLVLGVATLTPADVPVLERMLREARTWALVDNLAPAVIGRLFVAHPAALGKILDRWARDDDFWLRRAALLALLLPLREGAGDRERFSRYADAMLEDKEFFIRKAIGWVLRELSKRDPAWVSEWLRPRAERCAGVTWREAVKYLPEPPPRRGSRTSGR